MVEDLLKLSDKSELSCNTLCSHWPMLVNQRLYSMSVCADCRDIHIVGIQKVIISLGVRGTYEDHMTARV